jgi:hypothetical protein
VGIGWMSDGSLFSDVGGQGAGPSDAVVGCMENFLAGGGVVV